MKAAGVWGSSNLIDFKALLNLSVTPPVTCLQTIDSSMEFSGSTAEVQDFLTAPWLSRHTIIETLPRKGFGLCVRKGYQRLFGVHAWEFGHDGVK